MNRFLLFIIALLTMSYTAKANVKPNSLFSDHMVLQKGSTINVWGTADEGERITLNFHGQQVSGVAENGKWMLKLSAMPYVRSAQVMTISGKNTVLIKDILVGEVWLCSGQSNMERQLGPRPPQLPISDWEKERDAANYPAIREYNVPERYAKDKVDDVNSNWTVCSTATAADFSAVGYFFARDLYKKMNIPVGIIFSAFGGTHAEDWTSREALEANPALSELVKNYDKTTAQENRPKGKLMSGLYNGMIHPLIPYAIKGVAWYQGEANNARPAQYQVVLSNLIRNWRQDFRQGDFPFLIVQIAPFKDISPELREAQFFVSKTVKNTALIVTTDCGMADNIHPPHKQPVAERLALAASALAYGDKIAYSGPFYQSYRIKGDKVILNFSHVGKGLKADGAALKGFTIAGADGKFVAAEATIKGNKVIVSNPEVTEPVAARYGWANVPDGNLYNLSGLPASPFRTDKKPE
jgi:sialate O-acetylesterase